MNLLLQEIPASELAPKTIQETPPPADQDPLVAHGLQKGQYIGMIGLAIALIAAVGFFSPRVEYAIIFAIALSAVVIVFFLFV